MMQTMLYLCVRLHFQCALGLPHGEHNVSIFSPCEYTFEAYGYRATPLTIYLKDIFILASTENLCGYIFQQKSHQKKGYRKTVDLIVFLASKITRGPYLNPKLDPKQGRKLFQRLTAF